MPIEFKCFFFVTIKKIFTGVAFLFSLMAINVGVLFFPHVALAADIVLDFGVYTADKPTSVARQFRPILSAIESELSKTLAKSVIIRLQVSTSYEDGIQNLVNGKVDFARFGAASYIEAKEANPEISILAMESKKGGKQFSGIICVAKDSPIQAVSDIKGKRFAFGNERSTIGRYLSQLLLLQHNIKASDLSAYNYLDRHDKVGTAVAMGSYDAGALKESTFEKLVAKGEPLRPLVSFPNVTKPWLAKGTLPANIHQALRQALLELKDQKSLKSLKKDGFLPGSDADYDIIRQAILKNPGFFK
ncbi:MAG: PhnD/SsuA/transferrin family substrate-binding protein [Desulfobacteraceae bacterium]|nr:PhnD/SsuA/transferrin family substrate-binding protein [Desulfobacteraceae bacterium]